MMRKSKLVVGGSLFVVMFLVGGLSGNARGASDKKNYPGMLCHLLYDTDYTDQFYTSDADGGYPSEATRDAYWTGEVTNSDTGSSHHFGCPVVADCGANYSTGHWVYVRDRSANSIQCFVCVRDANSGSGACGSGDASTGSAGALERLDPGSVTTTYTYGYRFFQCVVPARDGGEGGSSIVGYGMDENC